MLPPNIRRFYGAVLFFLGLSMILWAAYLVIVRPTLAAGTPNNPLGAALLGAALLFFGFRWTRRPAERP